MGVFCYTAIMSNKIAQKYNSIYSKFDNTYGDEPSVDLIHTLEYISSGTALELGAGEGRNSFYLAQKGFIVQAVDVSEVGLNKLHNTLTEHQLTAEVIMSDITQFPLKQNYDVILSTFVLFHLSTSQAIQLIGNIKSHTNNNGVHLISTFTRDSDFYKVFNDGNNFYPETEELKEFYKDWEILEYREKRVKTRNKNPDGTPMLNTAATIIARKIS